jgi:chemotaxis protein methyltransferase CheR
VDDWPPPVLRIAHLIEARYGLNRTLQRERLLSFFGPRSAQEQARLADHLTLAPEQDPVWRDLVEAMLVHETFFYRHFDQLTVMRREVLPLLRQRQNTPIKVWCAGCSTGEEAYTLAFLMRDAACLGRILATDLSALSVATAQAGEYRRKPGLNSFRGLPADAWHYFDAHPTEPDRWTVAPMVRQMVDFTVHNLMTPLRGGFSADLISCRNTLIYFSEEALRQVEAMLVAAARPGTILLLGPAERLRYTDVFVPLTPSHPQILHWPLPEAS